jgi:hypothetical protein
MYLKAKDRTLRPRNKTARVLPHERFETPKRNTHVHKKLTTLWELTPAA